MKFFAVTGTNGKTSVAHLLRAVLTDAGYKSALIGTIGGNMTTPDPDLLYPLLEKLAGEDYDCVVCLLYTSGEERFSKKIASEIVKRRKESPIKTTLELVKLCRDVVTSKFARCV